MLRTLHIENYALIRQSDIAFDSGFVAITGETGAGKSILLGALNLLLGQRADSKTLYDSTRKCVVEAQFDTAALKLNELFAENDVDYSDDTVIIRREILPSGKSRAFVNDTPVQLPFLRQLGSTLIDIHSQHATLLLADSGFQTSLLDSIAGDQAELDEYRSTYRQYSDLKRKLEELTAAEQQNRKDYDYNKFLYDELAQAALADGEQEALEEEATLLANAENIKQALNQTVELCDGEEDSALQRLNASKSLISKVADCHKGIGQLHERLESSIIELRDIIATLQSLDDEITFSPERQEQVDERLDTIYRLQKKHNVSTVAELLTIQDNLDRQLGEAGNVDQQIKQVMEAVDNAFKTLQKKADALSKRRREAAAELETQIVPLFHDLGLANATLKADIKELPDYGPQGNNSILLLFNANKGGQLRELSKVASGGEMSRLMLAIKALTTRTKLLPTIIFDEIDAGISGDISVKVGRIMQRMAQGMQVVAITHLPQIAARAAQHYKVYKENNDEKTTSRIRQLDADERRHEIAVMLSSEPPSEAALQTATELMENN